MIVWGCTTPGCPSTEVVPKGQTPTSHGTTTPAPAAKTCIENCAICEAYPTQFYKLLAKCCDKDNCCTGKDDCKTTGCIPCQRLHVFAAAITANSTSSCICWNGVCDGSDGMSCTICQDPCPYCTSFLAPCSNCPYGPNSTAPLP